jgi:tripartite-type tricarboxylate transporter receptor subunit TctC
MRPATPAEFAAFVQSEMKAWGPVLRSSGIKME